jgi:hypothetical protein
MNLLPLSGVGSTRISPVRRVMKRLAMGQAEAGVFPEGLFLADW